MRNKSGQAASHRPSRTKRSEEHTSELQSRLHLVCRLLLEKKKNKSTYRTTSSINSSLHIYLQSSSSSLHTRGHSTQSEITRLCTISSETFSHPHPSNTLM